AHQSIFFVCILVFSAVLRAVGAMDGAVLALFFYMGEYFISIYCLSAADWDLSKDRASSFPRMSCSASHSLEKCAAFYRHHILRTALCLDDRDPDFSITTEFGRRIYAGTEQQRKLSCIIAVHCRSTSNL